MFNVSMRLRMYIPKSNINKSSGLPDFPALCVESRFTQLRALMLRLYPSLRTASTKEILRVTVGVITTASYKYSAWSSMKRKVADAEPSIVLNSKRRKEHQMATQKIPLTAQEQRLRSLLLDVAQFIDEAKQIQENIELRWAGGWVRDKLLGVPSHDIDTAINSMTGLAFCEQMKKYVDNPENVKKHLLKKGDLGNLHTIAANPEKSKHLETTTIKILGFDVDFVNLRKETYTQDSRNPQMEFGTAVEDAVRRDATINALFYNLHSDQVEDFCGGLADLDMKTIKTPLEPLTTFTDDPLRVLRLVRFASRLQFKIDPETEASMTNPAVNDALKVKISRERVGVEVEKMLKGL
jgi:tRNA nucleotidyltransferase (CCA-adding enzyme)